MVAPRLPARRVSPIPAGGMPNPLGKALTSGAVRTVTPPAMGDIQRRKKYLSEQLMAPSEPETVIEGLADLGSTAINGYFLNRANEDEQSVRASSSAALAQALQGGDVSSIFSGGQFEGLDPGQQALASALLEKQLSPGEEAKRYEVGNNLIDADGNVIYAGTPELKAPPTRQIGRNGQIIDQELTPEGWVDVGARAQFAPDKPSDRVTWRTVQDPITGATYQESSTGERKDAAGGVAGPDPEAEGKLRKEFEALPEVKSYNVVAPIYASMQESAGRGTRASDLNLVYGLAKIMDPGSVVREGEQVMVMNTASLPDWLLGQINRLNGGSALEGNTRTAIMAEAGSRVNQLKSQVDGRYEQYKKLAEQYRFDPSRIVPERTQLVPDSPTPSLDADEIIRRRLGSGSGVVGGPL